MLFLTPNQQCQSTEGNNLQLDNQYYECNNSTHTYKSEVQCISLVKIILQRSLVHIALAGILVAFLTLVTFHLQQWQFPYNRQYHRPNSVKNC